MSSKAQVAASRANGKRSRGPVTAAGKARSRYNGARHGIRSSAAVLPWESQQEYEASKKHWLGCLQPRDAIEFELSLAVVFAIWVHRRATNAQFEYVKRRAERMRVRAEKRVRKLMRRLFWDRCSKSHAKYGISNAACGEPQTSCSDTPNDPDEPEELVSELKSTEQGCEALLGHWQNALWRVENGRPMQAHDRLKLIRMLGKQPVDVAHDDQVRLIYVACFGLDPADREHPYEDLASDMSKPELEKFLARVRSRGPLVLDASNTPLCKKSLIDVITANIDELNARIEEHKKRADEVLASKLARLAGVSDPEGEKLARYELACHRRANRCLDAFWKYRKESERCEEQGGDWEPPGEEIGDLDADAEVADDVLSDQHENSPSEPEPSAGGAPQSHLDKELADVTEKLHELNESMAKSLAKVLEPLPKLVTGGESGWAAIEAEIFSGKPLLKPLD